ncbi:MAG TPA: hypothetical protein VIJ75_04995 [Hanamia sp.]
MKYVFFLFSVLLIISCNTSTTNEKTSQTTVAPPTGDELSAWADTPKLRIENWVKEVTDSK